MDIINGTGPKIVTEIPLEDQKFNETTDSLINIQYSANMRNFQYNKLSLYIN